MVKALLTLGRLCVTVPAFELLGAAAVLAGTVELAGHEWALIVGGGLAFVKSLDLALAKGK